MTKYCTVDNIILYLGILSNSQRNHSGQMFIQSKVSDMATFVLQERLDNWFLFHFYEIHPPSFALVPENYHVLFFSQGLGQGYHLSRSKYISQIEMNMIAWESRMLCFGGYSVHVFSDFDLCSHFIGLCSVNKD